MPLSSETAQIGTLNQVLGYEYDDDFALSTSDYAGGTESYSYDDDGLLTGAGDFTVPRKPENGLPEAVTGGGLNLTRTFNDYGETEAQNTAVSGQGIVSWSVIRDDNGRIESKTETVGGITSHFIFDYDEMGRLLTVEKDGIIVEEYQYHPFGTGTRVNETNTLRDISEKYSDYSPEDCLTTSGSLTYHHDSDGFLYLKTDGTEDTYYDYSLRGELLSVNLPDGSLIEYVHDPLGRRIAKKINGVIVEKYLWQGMTRLLAVYDGSNALLMRFEYADGRMPVAMTAGGATYYLGYDQVGTLKAVADASGNVVRKIDYDSFGNIISDSDPAFAVPFGFAGGLHDRDTGLVRFGYRDYDPDTGRWTAKDPILFAGGDRICLGIV